MLKNTGLILLALALLACCTELAPNNLQTNTEQASTSGSSEGNLERWYEASQVVRGATVFSDTCAVCHGANAEGTAEDWREPLADGSRPPPPLNGSAHAWHHRLSNLVQKIQTGGIDNGGKMPAFGDLLSDDDELAAIAYFQNFWNDETYTGWLDRGGVN